MTKKNLGSLFGGKIATISYNFSTSTEPSSCTITVLNENQVYQYPQFDQVVNIPPFNIPMKVVEYTVIHNEYKYLQVELVENLYSILDKNLILVYGEHTDQQSKINSDLSWIFKSGFVNKQYWGYGQQLMAQYITDRNYQPPTYPESLKFGDGVHILGCARASHTDIPKIEIMKGMEPEANLFVFDKGALRSEISFNQNNQQFEYTGQELGIQYGYYLKDLKNLAIKLGIKFNTKNFSLLDNDTVLFNEAGTLREVLSSALAKVGMTFYVNSFTQEIHVITNADLAQINYNIHQFHESFSEECATQKSFTRSIRGVDATHVVIRGDLTRLNAESTSGLQAPEPQLRTDKLYRVQANDITGLSSQELLTLYRFLPLVLLGVDEKIIESYIYLSAIKDGGTENWGDLYGKEHLKVNGEEYWSKKVPNYSGDLPEKTKDLIKLKNDLPASELGMYFKGEIATVKNLYSEKTSEGKTTQSEPIPPDTYISYIKDFGIMWGGIYISPPMTEREAKIRSYEDHEYNTKNKVVWTVASEDTLIGEVSILDFLYRLLSKRSEETKTTLSITVGELARKSGAIRRRQTGVNSGFGGGQDNSSFNTKAYHVIAIHYFPIGKGIGKSGENLTVGINRSIGGNIAYFDYDGKMEGTKSTAFLAGTNDANKMYQSMKKNLDKILDDTLKVDRNIAGGIATDQGRTQDSGKSFPKNIILKYIKAKDDNGKSYEPDDPPLIDEGMPMFIKHIPYNGNSLFYGRKINLLSMRLSEAQHFLNHFGSLNPPTPAPLISSNISYSRPPLISDFDINKGLSSLSMAIGADGGITTEASYSSRQFINVDITTHRDYLGANSSISRNSIVATEPNFRNAFGIING